MDNTLFIDTVGSSMRPFLRNGEKVIVKRLGAQELKIGDIMLYESSILGQKICHRLIKKINVNGKLILCARGDTRSPDVYESIQEDRIIGKVVGILRNGRIVSLTGVWQNLTNWLIAKCYPSVKIPLKHLLKALGYKKSFKHQY